MTDGPVKMLHTVVSLDYERPPTLAAREYMEGIRQKKLVGHRCPECGRTYLPPRGYCPVCAVPTGAEGRIEIADRGVVVTFTVIRPDPKVQKSLSERTCRATIMLDGSTVTTMGEIKGIDPDGVRSGMRVRAIWADQLTEEDQAVLRGGWGVAGIRGWEPTGEPDVPAAEVQKMTEAAQL
jgi:uncharacterized OB-fold protein